MPIRINRQFSTVLAAFLLFLLAIAGGSLNAGDAEDTRDIVGKWRGGFLVDSVEFKADGTYKFGFGGGGKWRISNRKLITETIFGLNMSDYTLGRDTFIWLGETRYRQR